MVVLKLRHYLLQCNAGLLSINNDFKPLLKTVPWICLTYQSLLLRVPFGISLEVVAPSYVLCY